MNQTNQKSQTNQENKGYSDAVAIPKPSLGLKVTFMTLFSFIGKMMSITFEFKDFEIDKLENEMLSEQADQVTAEFVPSVDNKYIKLIVFIVSLVSVFGKKYFDYMSFINKKDLKNKKEDENKVEIKELKA